MIMRSKERIPLHPLKELDIQVVLSGINGFCSGQVLDSHRFESDLPAGCLNGFNAVEDGNLSSRNNGVSGVEPLLYYTDHPRENTVSNLHLGQMTPKGLTEDPPMSSGGKNEHQKC